MDVALVNDGPVCNVVRCIVLMCDAVLYEIVEGKRWLLGSLGTGGVANCMRARKIPQALPLVAHSVGTRTKSKSTAKDEQPLPLACIRLKFKSMSSACERRQGSITNEKDR